MPQAKHRCRRRRGFVALGLSPFFAAVLPVFLATSERVKHSAMILEVTAWSLRQVDLEATASKLELEVVAYADIEIPPELRSPKLDEMFNERRKKGATARQELRKVLEQIKADPPPDVILRLPTAPAKDKAEFRKFKAEWEADINRRLAKLDAPATQPATRSATRPSRALAPAKDEPLIGDLRGAKRIVIVCDTGQGMFQKGGSLKNELNKSLSNLDESQAFDIVLIDDSLAVFSRDWLKKESVLPATTDNRRSASSFFEDVPTSRKGDVNAGLAVAFERKPDLIVLVAAQDFPVDPPLVAKVSEWNKPINGKAAVRINTIYFANDKEE
jgi:hypothetical protein